MKKTLGIFCLLFLLEFSAAQYGQSSWFQCYDGQWISTNQQCNGRTECSQGEDELGCGQSIIDNLVLLPEQHQTKRRRFFGKNMISRVVMSPLFLDLQAKKLLSGFRVRHIVDSLY